jgi:beta-lactamase superfamily II metal-dependent hydrolase
MTEIPRASDGPPAPHELEVSLFGPGFGESVLIHVGAGHWIVIDSCINVLSGKPVALEYLERIGVPSSSVDLIIATHWHADHIRGLSALVATCERAQFCCSAALNNHEFLSIANLYADVPLKLAAGPNELYDAFNTVIGRRGSNAYHPIKWLRSDMDVVSAHNEIEAAPVPIRLRALSPSDEMLTRAVQEMAQQLAVCRKSEQLGVLTPGHPNHISVALQVQVGARHLLLGSDLEETGDPLIGWSAVLSSTSRPREAAEVFKVAHHGSKSGHNDEVWSSMLQRDPMALLTPFRWGRHRLPAASDRQRILALTERAFITAHPEKDKSPGKRSVKVERLIADTVRRRWVAAGSLGHVRWRADILDHNDAGTIELFGAAMPLSKVA